ncbi:hypothetical protein Taro_014265 [Colocasia esculenta]|uniref:Uncharacterized protein n=1 Tax=Colocasia esculenta TaxID=4460 RepID=A0A843UED6_COLES|nr:hypothetical protein [Colocasia esculenta]
MLLLQRLRNWRLAIPRADGGQHSHSRLERKSLQCASIEVPSNLAPLSVSSGAGRGRKMSAFLVFDGLPA